MRDDVQLSTMRRARDQAINRVARQFTHHGEATAVGSPSLADAAAWCQIVTCLEAVAALAKMNETHAALLADLEKR